MECASRKWSPMLCASTPPPPEPTARWNVEGRPGAWNVERGAALAPPPEARFPKFNNSIRVDVRTRPRWSPVSTADHSEGSGHRLGTMRDGCERQFDVRFDEHFSSNHVNDVDDYVIEKVNSILLGPRLAWSSLRLLIDALSARC